jgi:hypothetical protein
VLEISRHFGCYDLQYGLEVLFKRQTPGKICPGVVTQNGTPSSVMAVIEFRLAVGFPNSERS